MGENNKLFLKNKKKRKRQKKRKTNNLGLLSRSPLLNKKKERTKMKIYYFTSPSCPPCRRFGPIISELQEEFDITKVSVVSAESQRLAQKHRITTVPTLVIMENNKELGRFSGYRSKEETKSFLLSKTS